jgi:hypothetical protein
MPNGPRFPPRDVLSHPTLEQLVKLNTPQRVQDFLDSLPINFEKRGETCSSPLVSLERGTVHCLEGAFVACLALWMNGAAPLVMDLKTTDDDVDHVVALFTYRRHWGAISKTNHGVLRFREPIFRDLHALAASFFHEYSLPDGRKTLRTYSAPFDLRRYRGDWVLTRAPLWTLERQIDQSRHLKLLNRSQIARLRRASNTEIRAGELVEWRA